MPKYNFYNVVYRYNSGNIEEDICIAKSKNFVKKTLLADIEILKIEKLDINAFYKDTFKDNIISFINSSKLKKFKIITFNPETEKIITKTVLAESKREIYSKHRDHKVFYVFKETPSFDEYCKYYFE